MSIQVATPIVAAKAPDTAPSTTPPKGPTTASLSKKAAPTEVPSLRSTYSNTVDNHDGTYTASVSSTPINYQPAGSTTYQPIDLTLAPIKGGNGRVRASKTPAPVEVGAPDDAAGFVSVDTGKDKISLRIAPGARPGRAGSKPVAASNHADVAGLLPGVDLRVVPSSDGDRLFLTLASRPATSSFTFALDSGTLVPSLQADGSINFTDKAGSVAARMPAPYATDSTASDRAGVGQFTNLVSYALSTSGAQNLLTVSVDPSWLASATYPVYVDPSTSVTGAASVTNTFVSHYYTTTNFRSYNNGTYYEMWLGMDPSNSSNYNYDLIKFNLPAAVMNATIENASLAVYPWWQYYHSSPITTWVNQITSSWDVNNVIWNNQPPSTFLMTDNTTQGYYSGFNVTSLVQKWSNGSAANYGFLLHENGNNAGYWKRLIATAQGGNIPQLNITYSVPSAAVTSVGWTNNSTLSWNYSSNGGPAQAWYRLILWQNFGSSWNQIVDTGNVWSSASSYTVSPSALTNGGSYVWTVAVSDGYSAVWAGGSWLASVGTFNWDTTLPTWQGFTSPTASTTAIATSDYTVTWNTPADISGVAAYGLVPQTAPIGAPGTCSSAWSNYPGWMPWYATNYRITGMTSGWCYRLATQTEDGAGNWSGLSYSNPILVDTTTPPAPSVTGSGTGVFQPGGANTDVFYKPVTGAGTGSIAINATATAAPSGTKSITFTAPLGWNASGVTNSSETLTYDATALAASLTTTVTSNSGKTSTTLINLKPDTHAPTIGSFVVSPASSAPVPLAANSTAYQSASTATIGWNESDGESTVDASSLKVSRLTAKFDPAAGSCVGLNFQPDSTFAANPAINGANVTLADTGLADGYCYEWQITLSDKVGNQAVMPSGALMIDKTAPAVPSVTGTGIGAYQTGPGQPVYVNANGSGSVSLSSSSSQGVSGVGSSTFTLSPSQTTGWSLTDPANPNPAASATVNTNPAVAKYGWTAMAVNSSVTVYSSSKAGVVSPSVSVALTPDVTPPTVSFPDLAGTTLTSQNSTSYTLRWGESDAGSGVGTNALTRWVAPMNPGTPANCSGVAYVLDGTFHDTSSVTAGNGTSADTGLADGHCYEWQLTVTDNVGNSRPYTSGAVLVDTLIPAARLAVAPRAGAPVAGNVTISGIAWDADFGSYSLDYGAGASPTSWTSLVANSTTKVGDPVANTAGTLGVWATGSMTGVYTVRLTVTDGVGNKMVLYSTVYVDNTDRGSEPFNTYTPFASGGGWDLGVNVATGEARVSRSLFEIPAYGPAQSLALTYNSADSHPGDPLASPLGAGWSSNLTQYLDVSNKAAGFIVWHRADGAEVPFGLIDGVWAPLSGHYEALTTTSSGYAIAYVDHSSLGFDSLGRIVAISDRYGKSLTIAWGNGSATATDAPGRSTTITFSGSRITGVTDSAGRAWSFGYSGAGNTDLASVTDPLGNATTFTYDGSHDMATMSRQLTTTNPDGTTKTDSVVWTVGYKAASGYPGLPVSSVSDPKGASTTFAYGAPFGSGPTVVSTPGDTTFGTPDKSATYELDPNGRGWVDSLVDAWSGQTGSATTKTVFTYDTSGNVTSIARQMDATHSSTKVWTYDDSGHVKSETDPLAWTTGGAYTTSTTTYTYDRVGDLQTRTVSGSSVGQAISVETAYIYDAAGHECLRVDNLTVDPTNLGCTSTIPVATSDSNIVTTYAYNGLDELVSQTDGLGAVTAYAYDQFGDRSQTTRNFVAAGPTDDTTNLVTSYTYDAAGNTLTETDPIDNLVIPATTATTVATYDALGNQLTKTGPGDSWAPSSETVYGYDEFGQASSSLTCAPAKSVVSDCAAAYLTKNITSRDWLDRTVKATLTTPSTDSSSSITTTSTMAYDLAGNVVAITGADGVTKTQAYDGVDRVVSESGVNGTTKHTYDGMGNETQTVAPASNTTTATTTRTFNADGTVATLSADAAGTITYAYDAIGRQAGSTNAAGFALSSSTYDHLGRVTLSMVTNKVTSVAPAQALTAGQTTTVATYIDTSYDAAGHVLTRTDPYLAGALQKTTTAISYDALGRATKKIANYIAGSTDSAANLTTLTYYDAAGNPVASVDPKGVVTRNVYDLAGVLAQTIANCSEDDAHPSTHPATCTGTGGSQNGWNVKSSSGLVSGTGQIVVTTTTGTITTTTTYDGAGRILKTVIDPATGGLKLETDYAYDSAGRLIAQATPSPTGVGKVVKVVVYDSAGTGRISSTIENCRDIGGDAVWSACTGSAGYDGTANLKTSYGYDTASHVTLQTAPGGATTAYTYDAAGRVSSVTSSTGAVANYYYDAAGRKIAQAVSNESNSYTVTRYLYDAAGHLSASLANCTDSGTTAPSGDTAIAACAARGTWNSTTNVLTVYTYSPTGNLLATTAPSPADTGTGGTYVTTAYAYDANNRLCRVLQNATVSLQTSSPCSDPLPNGTSVTASQNVMASYTYDAAGYLASQTLPADPSSHQPSATTAYTYDALGHVLTKTDPLQKTTTWTYDLNGNKATETDPDTNGGPTVAGFYDAAGRLCRRVAASSTGHLDLTGVSGGCTGSIPGAAIDYAYVYDPASNPKTASDAFTGQTISASYDADHRAASVGDSGGAIGYADQGTTYLYTSASTVTRTDPSGIYNFTLDQLGRETGLSNPLKPANDQYAWAYGPTGALKSETDPLGDGTVHLATAYTYTALGQLSSKVSTKEVGGPTVASYTYAYNAAGNQLSSVSSIVGSPANVGAWASGTSSYSYDPLGRLTSALTPAQPTTQQYTWNGTADRASVKSGSAPAFTTYLDVASRPVSDNALPAGSYSSDGEGRITSKPGQTLSWDGFGRLVKLVDATLGTTTYTYDPLDRLVSKLNNGTTTTYVYVGLTSAIAEVLVAGSTTTTTYHATDLSGIELYEYQIDPTTHAVTSLTYLGRNGHGDLTWTSDSTATVTSTMAYDAFGWLVTSAGSALAPSWQGSTFDSASGLYYVIARWYSPALGRFLSNDPIPGKLARPQTLDPYAYGAGDSINATDPSGEVACRGGGDDDCRAHTKTAAPITEAVEKQRKADRKLQIAQDDALRATRAAHNDWVNQHVVDDKADVGTGFNAKAGWSPYFTVELQDWDSSGFWWERAGDPYPITENVLPGQSNFLDTEAKILALNPTDLKAYLDKNGPYALYVMGLHDKNNPDWPYWKGIVLTAKLYLDRMQGPCSGNAICRQEPAASHDMRLSDKYYQGVDPNYLTLNPNNDQRKVGVMDAVAGIAAVGRGDVAGFEHILSGLTTVLVPSGVQPSAEKPDWNINVDFGAQLITGGGHCYAGCSTALSLSPLTGSVSDR